MTDKQAALARVVDAHGSLQNKQADLATEQENFAKVCREAYEHVNDREMAEATGYSRARIQQYRQGDSRKRER